MPRRLILSKRTSKKLDKLLEYLETEWSEKVKRDYLSKFEETLKLVKEKPEIFPSTETVKGLHKCVITKQTTVYYRFDELKIYIVTLFDNRQNPKKLKDETK